MKKNMQDYNRVLGRVHISGRCREELLRAAAAGEQPRESRRVIMLDRALPALTGAAACLILLSCGGILLSGLREKRLEMQTASEAQTTAEHTQHSAETSTVQAAEVTGTADREKEGIAYQTTLSEDADRAPLFVTTAAAEIITAAADTVTTTGETVITTVEPQVSSISSATILQDTAATTSGSEAAVSTEETTQTETTQKEPEILNEEGEMQLLVLPGDVITACIEETGDGSFEEFLQHADLLTGGKTYRLDDSLYIAAQWLELMYANDLLSSDELLASMQTLANGERLSDSFIEYATSQEVIRECVHSEIFRTQKWSESMGSAITILQTMYPVLLDKQQDTAPMIAIIESAKESKSFNCLLFTIND